MAVLTRWHVGPWTTRGTRPGEPFEAGRKRTPDELNFDVVGLARILGRRLSGREELQVRLWQNELRPTHTRMCGVHTLADPSNAQLLHDTAREALAWLDEGAPAGYEFVLTDAVELRPILDPDAEVVAVDAVVQLAEAPQPDFRLTNEGRRVDPGHTAADLPQPDPGLTAADPAFWTGKLPASRLATSHVRRSAAGDWYAGDAACNWSGPHDSADAAVAAVHAARTELVEQLRAVGREDLAATAPRWPAVPVERV